MHEDAEEMETRDSGLGFDGLGWGSNSFCGSIDVSSSSPENFSELLPESPLPANISGFCSGLSLHRSSCCVSVPVSVFSNDGILDDVKIGLFLIISSLDELFAESREFHLSLSLLCGEFQLSLPEDRLEVRLDFFGKFQLPFSEEELRTRVFCGELQLPLLLLLPADPTLELDF